MRHLLTAALLLVAPLAAGAAEPPALLQAAVDGHVRPGFDALAARSDDLVAASLTTCDRDDPALRAAFAAAWDAWIRMSHLRIGPTEVDNRAFSLGYWPDARGFIPKTLQALIAAEDGAVDDPAAFKAVSIAAHGFTALEELLYAPDFAAAPPYACRLMRAVAADIAGTAHAIADDWTGAYGAAFLAPGTEGAPYRTATEALAALYSTITAQIQFDIDARMGRPMGTFDRPRPTRAEALNSGRALRHLELTLTGTRDLARILVADRPENLAAVEAAYDRALTTLARIEDPGLGDVADPMGRFRVETAQQRLGDVNAAVRGYVGGALGLTEGFNSQDGD